MFAVLFDLEGQLDCTLHETKAGADAEAARLSEKYAAERANYSTSVAVQAARLPPAYAEAPAMLAALRKAQELLRELEAPAHLDEGAALDDEITAIIARIDGNPTARAGVWRIITGTHCAEWLYWSNASGWGSLAQSDGFPQAERKTVNLPIGGQWWFDDEGEPDPTAQPIEGEG